MNGLEILTEKLEGIIDLVEDSKTAIKNKGVNFESAKLEDLPGLIRQIPSKDNMPNANQYNFGATDYTELTDDEGNILMYDENNPLIT